MQDDDTLEHGDETQGAEDELQQEQTGKGYGEDEGEREEALTGDE